MLSITISKGNLLITDRLINNVYLRHLYSIHSNVDETRPLSVCGRCVMCIFRFDKRATPRNAVNDRGIFRCICLDISDSGAWYCSVKFLLSSPFERSYSQAVLFIVDIVCRLHNSSVCLEERVSHIEKGGSGTCGEDRCAEKRH